MWRPERGGFLRPGDQSHSMQGSHSKPVHGRAGGPMNPQSGPGRPYITPRPPGHMPPHHNGGRFPRPDMFQQGAMPGHSRQGGQGNFKPRDAMSGGRQGPQGAHEYGRERLFGGVSDVSRVPSSDRQEQKPQPYSMAKKTAPGVAASVVRSSDADFKEVPDIVVPHAALGAVSFVERVRALNALAAVGNAARCDHSPAAIKVAATTFRSGEAMTSSAFADDVTMYVPAAFGAAAAATRNTVVRDD